eukprot:TRINITY_DN7090_c0_g1_i1.p1 TRINITY_DN7090_c0_g1~~TRINITY_DN7090_c0_g1_i1.p1  ORF type:complete len:188 (-),score=66.52 TRINITY_DN7090_c0_g1_i1:268-831(-)
MRAILSSLRPQVSSRSIAPQRAFSVITTKELNTAKEQGVGSFIDVRPAVEYYNAHPKGFTSFPFVSLTDNLDDIPKGNPVYVVDRFGYYAKKAATILEGNGYSNVNVVKGGMLLMAFEGYHLTSSDPDTAAQWDAELSREPTAATIEALAKEHDLHVDMSKEEFPLVDTVYTKAEQEAGLHIVQQKK